MTAPAADEDRSVAVGIFTTIYNKHEKQARISIHNAKAVTSAHVFSWTSAKSPKGAWQENLRP